MIKRIDAIKFQVAMKNAARSHRARSSRISRASEATSLIPFHKRESGGYIEDTSSESNVLLDTPLAYRVERVEK